MGFIPVNQSFHGKGAGFRAYGMDMLGIDGNGIFMLVGGESVFLFYFNEFFIQF